MPSHPTAPAKIAWSLKYQTGAAARRREVTPSAKAAPAMSASAIRRAEVRAAAVAEARAYAIEVIELCQKLGRPGHAPTAIQRQERDYLRGEVAKRTAFAPATEDVVASWARAFARAVE